MALAAESSLSTPDRNKRGADDAFGIEGASRVDDSVGNGGDASSSSRGYGVGRERSVRDGGGQSADAGCTDPGGVQDLGTRMMAHFLGLDVPGMEPSTSFYPGYEWWHRSGQGGAYPQQQQQQQPQQGSTGGGRGSGAEQQQQQQQQPQPSPQVYGDGQSGGGIPRAWGGGPGPGPMYYGYEPY